MLDGQPWFVAVDLYDILYGRRSGLSARLYIKPDETMTVRKGSAQYALSSLFTGSANAVALISESGMYKLVMHSRKPAAKSFQNWVTEVLLPAVRKGDVKALMDISVAQPLMCRARGARGTPTEEYVVTTITKMNQSLINDSN